MRNIIIIAVLLLLLLPLLRRYYFHYTIRCKLPCIAAVILARPLIFATVVENIYYRGHTRIFIIKPEDLSKIEGKFVGRHEGIKQPSTNSQPQLTFGKIYSELVIRCIRANILAQHAHLNLFVTLLTGKYLRVNCWKCYIVQCKTMKITIQNFLRQDKIANIARIKFGGQKWTMGG